MGGLGQRAPAQQRFPASQVTPTSSRAPTTGASPRAASRPSRTPPDPWAPSGWTARPPALALAPPGPPERLSSPNPATVIARSTRPPGGCPRLRCRRPCCCCCCPCWWGTSPPAEGRPLASRRAASPPPACGGGDRCPAPSSAPGAGPQSLGEGAGRGETKAGPGTEPRKCSAPLPRRPPRPCFGRPRTVLSPKGWLFSHHSLLTPCSASPAWQQRLGSGAGSLEDRPDWETDPQHALPASLFQKFLTLYRFRGWGAGTPSETTPGTRAARSG